MELVIASSNLHKVRELKTMLKSLGSIDVRSLRDFPNYSLPAETGKTFEEIAKEKASHAGKALERAVLADDSGIVVPTLGNEPGIYSRRYAGEEATDEENRQKLLKALQGKEGLERAAYFECALALYLPGEETKCVTGRCEGIITNEERGRNGFGYDPIFQKFDYLETFAELSDEVKNQISHRSKALEKMLIFLESHKSLLVSKK